MLLSACAAGHLDEDETKHVRAHADECRECTAFLRVDTLLRSAIDQHGAAVFTPHPSSDDLVSAIVLDGRLDGAARAGIETHLAVCGACRADADLVRGATAPRTEPWWTRVWRESRVPAIAIPALGACVIALSLPAYRSFVDLPRVRSDNERHVSELREARERVEVLRTRLDRAEKSLVVVPPPAAPPVGGLATPLYLPRTVRSGEDAVPTVDIRRSAAVLPILVSFDPQADGTAANQRVLIVSVRSQRTGRVTWSLRARARELSDPAYHTMTVLVPSSAVRPGMYTLSVRDAASGRAEYSAPFRVRG